MFLRRVSFALGLSGVVACSTGQDSGMWTKNPERSHRVDAGVANHSANDVARDASTLDDEAVVSHDRPDGNTAGESGEPTPYSNDAGARPFQLALYHGGVNKSLSAVEYKTYLDKLAKFVIKRKIDKVFVDVGDYESSPYKGPEPLADFLVALPSNVVVGAVLEINPKYSFRYDKPLLPGGFTCGAKTAPSVACPATDARQGLPAGCPNNMEKAYDLLARANQAALQKRPDATLFTDFIADKENAGTYGGHMCNFLEAAKTYIVPGLPDGFHGASSPKEKLGLIRVGHAGEGSMNAPDLIFSARFSGTCSGDNACTNYPYDGVNNVEAFPELYWYMQELKEKGCIGCDHSLTPSALAATRPSECAACADPKCQGLAHFYTDGDSYTTCLNSGCPSSCCKCLGCVPCRYDASGKAPNPAIMYQAHLNQPVAMADDVVKSLEKLALLDNLKRANTWSMFSIEVAHDWQNIRDPVSGKVYSADGADASSADTCIARKFGGDICGTFDGFGNWSWEAFEQFLFEYHKRTGIKTLAVYEWQFVFPEWL